MSPKRFSGLAAWSSVLTIILVRDPVSGADVDASATRLIGSIEYVFVGDRGQTDDDGRVLVWEASVEGDLVGETKWWFEDPAPIPAHTYDGGRVTFYAARWEYWSDGQVILAGESAGKTVFPDGSDGMWDGQGVVTEAHGRLESLKDRRIYETGPVILGTNPPLSYSGSGLFQIY